jgi:hypothetical protein
MDSLQLAADLVAFLAAGRRLEYDPATCEAGAVTLVPLADLRLERFPMETGGLAEFPQDPHFPKRGSYLVAGVNLTADCTGGYEAVGLLLWLPVEQRYATWDDSHCTIRVFGPEVTWEGIAAAPARHINAQWSGIDPESPPVADLVPWPAHPYSERQLHHPQPAEPSAAADPGPM